MNDSIYRVLLEVKSARINKILHAKQNDTARRLEITLTDGGLPYIITEGCYAVLTATKPNRLNFYAECEIKGDKIVYQFERGFVDEPGEMMCEVTLYDDADKQITTAAFDMVVEPKIYNDGDEIALPKNATRVLLSPLSAKVGQYLRVVEVDEDGRVVRLVAVDGGVGNGAVGASAYEIALRNGFVGTEQEWLDSLVGPPGAEGQPGADGKTPVKGEDYFTEEEKQEMVDAVELEITDEIATVSITEHADGSVTFVNTFESGGTETISVPADENGNPAGLIYNGVEIPLTFTVETEVSAE